MFALGLFCIGLLNSHKSTVVPTVVSEPTAAVVSKPPSPVCLTESQVAYRNKQRHSRSLSAACGGPVPDERLCAYLKYSSEATQVESESDYKSYEENQKNCEVLKERNQPTNADPQETDADQRPVLDPQQLSTHEPIVPPPPPHDSGTAPDPPVLSDSAGNSASDLERRQNLLEQRQGLLNEIRSLTKLSHDLSGVDGYGERVRIFCHSQLATKNIWGPGVSADDLQHQYEALLSANPETADGERTRQMNLNMTRSFLASSLQGQQNCETMMTGNGGAIPSTQSLKQDIDDYRRKITDIDRQLLQGGQ